MFSSMWRPAMLVPTISPRLIVMPFENVNEFITLRPVPTGKLISQRWMVNPYRRCSELGSIL